MHTDNNLPIMNSKKLFTDLWGHTGVGGGGASSHDSQLRIVPSST